MVGKAGLKAGLIGVAIMLVITAMNQVLPIAGALVYVICGISTLVYVGIGVLAGFFLVPPRTPKQGGGAGAIAGLLSGGVNTVVGTTILFFRLSRGMNLPGMTPEQMQMITESGMDPSVLAISSTIGAVCAVAIGVGAAAIGGAIFAAIKSD